VDVQIRPIQDEELNAFAKANGAAFGWDPNVEVLAETRQVLELDRTLAAFDGDEIAGTTAIFSFDMTVPGSALPTAGVTWVSVKPTHRRRGVLRRLMQRQLSDVRDRGEAIAALWASESIIYGRFGYGLAAQGSEFTIQREHTDFADEPLACGRTRLVDREEALRLWPAVYDEVLPHYPGMYSRSDAWWRCHTMRETDFARAGGTRFYVQYEEDGRILGFARYRVRGGDQDGLPGGTVLVQELFGTTDQAHAALWRYIFGVDLVSKIQAHHRPADDPLFWMLADPRRLVRRHYDTLWVRPVDVPVALEARRYPATGRVVLDVRDAFCPWVAGRYELEAGPEGARCRPSDKEPDVTLSAGDLGAIYMGGARLTTLRHARRVEGEWPALRRADALFSWDPQPWCPEVF
jgi:predicted acetyltransferase